MCSLLWWPGTYHILKWVSILVLCECVPWVGGNSPSDQAGNGNSTEPHNARSTHSLRALCLSIQNSESFGFLLWVLAKVYLLSENGREKKPCRKVKFMDADVQRIGNCSFSVYVCRKFRVISGNITMMNYPTRTLRGRQEVFFPEYRGRWGIREFSLCVFVCVWYCQVRVPVMTLLFLATTGNKW